jgi:hypothetical protein
MLPQYKEPQRHCIDCFKNSGNLELAIEVKQLKEKLKEKNILAPTSVLNIESPLDRIISMINKVKETVDPSMNQTVFSIHIFIYILSLSWASFNMDCILS